MAEAPVGLAETPVIWSPREHPGGGISNGSSALKLASQLIRGRGPPMPHNKK